MQEEKRPETPNLNHTLIHFTVSRTNDFAAEVTKRIMSMLLVCKMLTLIVRKD